MYKILKYSLIIFLLFWIVSCSDNNKSAIISEDENNRFEHVYTNIPFAGQWVSEDYYETVKKNKSIVYTDGKFIVIPDSTLITTMFIFDFHEGGKDLTIIKNIDNYELLTTNGENSEPLEFEMKVKIISEDKIKIGNEVFVKLNSINKDNDVYVLEEILFKGKYTDSLGRNIEFTKDGKLKGFGNLKYYSPSLDISFFGFDEVGMGKTKDKMDFYHFKFNEDTLLLYNIKCLDYDSLSEECMDYDKSELTYKLWRK